MVASNPDERHAQLAAQVLDELEGCSIIHQSVEDLQALEEFPNSDRGPRASLNERQQMLNQFPTD